MKDLVSQWRELSQEVKIKINIIFHLFLVNLFLLGLFVLLVAVGGGGGYWFFKSRKIVVKAASDHIVLQKNENLKETLEVMAEDNPQLFREFRQLELEVSQIVQDSTANSQKEMNKKHNRYIDIGG